MFFLCFRDLSTQQGGYVGATNYFLFCLIKQATCSIGCVMWLCYLIINTFSVEGQV